MILSAKLTETPAFIRPQNKSYFYIDQNHKLFQDLYKSKLVDYMNKMSAAKWEYKNKLQAFESKECDHCGGEIRYIEGYEFWGCVNYKAAGPHRSFSGKEPNIWDGIYTVPIQWLTDIIFESGFKGKVKAKELLEFYESCGYEDLRSKYGFSSTWDQINRYTKTNRRSKEQEEQCLNYLKTRYSKVLYQQCITYQIEGKKETFCIPDFICSDKNSVYVVDAKLSFVEDEKMDLYVSLVKFILNVRKDTRSVFGAHIMYEGEQFGSNSNSRYAIILIKQ